jgi:hypothetical protein
MLVLMVLKDCEAAEDDEVAFVIDLCSILGHRGDLVVAGVGRVCQQIRQCQQTTRLAWHLLAVDLLKAQDIGIDSEELRPHEGDTLVECGLLARFVVEVLKVKCGDA